MAIYKVPHAKVGTWDTEIAKLSKVSAATVFHSYGSETERTRLLYDAKLML